MRKPLLSLYILLLMSMFFFGIVSTLWASAATGGQQLDEAPAVTDRPQNNRNVRDDIIIQPDYDGDQDMEFNPGVVPRNPPPGPQPPLPPRQQEALDASRVKIREKYKEEKQALYDQYQQDLKDHQTHMVEERQQLQDDIEEDYAEKRESLKEQQQAKLSDARTNEEKRAINKKYKKELRLLSIAKNTEKVSARYLLSQKNKEKRKALKEHYLEARDKAFYTFRRNMRMGTRTPEYQKLINAHEF